MKQIFTNKLKLLLLSILIYNINCFAQIKTYTIDPKNSINVFYSNKKLKFLIKNGATKQEFEFGHFDIDSTLFNSKNFLVKNSISSKIETTNFINVHNKYFFVSIADWNDRYYVFSFIKNKEKIVPLLFSDGKIRELFVTEFPFVYYNSQCGVILNIEREIQEYNYGNFTKNYFDVVVYNLNSTNEDIDNNLLRLDSSSWDFYGELSNSDDLEFFKDVYTRIYDFLKLCGNN